MLNKIWRRRANDERGAVLIIATVGFVLAVIATALAVDLGRLAQERRRDQKVADMAALDAARDFANMQGRAEQSARNNGFPVGTPGYTVKAVEGKKLNGKCEEMPGSGTVCVTVSSPHKNSFVSGGNAVAARAVAGLLNGAEFCMGSSFLSANLDEATQNLPLLNRVFGRFLAGPTGQANVLSYQGLAAATVKWRQLQAALGFGTVNEMLTTNITMAQLLTATATVLNNQGVTSYDVYSDVIRLKDSTTNQQTFKLGDIFSVASGYENKLLDSDVNVFNLVTSSAELANKNNLIDAGTIVNLPIDYLSPIADANVQGTLKIKVIEAPQCALGPSGTVATTSQAEVTISAHITVGSNLSAPTWLLSLLSIVGSANLKIDGDVNVKYTMAGATGTMQEVRCASPQGITVRVNSQPITTHVDGTLSVYSSVVTQLISSNVKVNVSFNPPDVNSLAREDDLSFAYPTEFWPSTVKSTPGVPLGISLTQGNVTTTVGAAGLLETLTSTLKLDGTGSVEAAIIDPILNPVLNAIAGRITNPALRALGLAVGPVDVWAPADKFDPTSCGQPGLLG